MDPNTTSVTGVLVTGKTPERYPLAKKAVAAWQYQNYPGPRQLLIINDHPTQALYKQDELPEHVHEIRVRKQLPLGSLRNTGMALAQGDYVVQWDDDDYSHRERLVRQVMNTEPGKASIFRWEIHCNLKTGQAFANCGDEIRGKGFPGTMLWPKDVAARFPATGKAEDTEFILDLRAECGLQVLNNKPELYFRCYHGHNTWSEQHVMKRKRGSRDLNPEERAYVDSLLNGTYKQIVEGLRSDSAD